MYTNKLILGVVMTTLVVIGGTSAANIGTGIVQGSGGLNQAVVWNDIMSGGVATGSINGLVVRARVQPTLNMVISGSGIIDLGVLSSSAYSTGSVDIEIGTNSPTGASVTAKSNNAGLVNGTHSINNNVADLVVDSYRFSSAILNPTDSVFTITQSATLNTEVNNSTTTHTLYTSNRPQPVSGAVNDFRFSISAMPNPQTPAGDYVDVVQVNVVGTF